MILLLNTHVSAATIFLKEIGNTELEMEFEMYYMPLGWYIPFTASAMEKVTLTEEYIIYKHLISNLFSPRFVVLEASTYPMPVLGLLSRKYTPGFYNSAKITKNFNLIESITSSGFKEPWAFSLFIGDIIKFARIQKDEKETSLNKKGIDYDGKGYSGFLFSYGNYHIKRNELIKSHWLEMEIKIKAQKSSKNQKMYMSYKLGTKLYFNKDIKSLAYIGIKRDRLDYNYYKFSFIKNSLFEFRFDFDIETGDFLELFCIIGKRFPLKQSRIVPGFNIGVVWDLKSLYLDSLEEPGAERKLTFIIRPSVRF